MNAFWFTIVLAVVASAVSVSEAEDSKLTEIPIPIDDHNIITCDTGDQTNWVKLDAETVSASGKPGEIVERTLTYPTEGAGNYEIVCIRVIDQFGDGTGGIPSIVEGGLWFRYVILHFQSQRGQGFKFNVEIHGKPI